MRNILANNRGYLIIAAYAIPVLLGLVALVLEFNQIRNISNDLKAAVDAAAIAGVINSSMYADVIEEGVYDSNGNLIRIDKKTFNHRIINNPDMAMQNARNVFMQNMREMGWGTDGTTRVTVYPSDMYGEVFASGMSDAVTGKDVPEERMDYSDVDEFYFSAKARVKTLFIAPMLKILGAISGKGVPVDDLGYIVLEKESKARVKMKVE